MRLAHGGLGLVAGLARRARAPDLLKHPNRAHRLEFMSNRVMARHLLLLAGLLVAAPPAPAQPTLYISPRLTGMVAPGGEIIVEVRIANYQDLRGYSVEVLYNQAALRHTAISQGNVFTLGGGPGGLFLASASMAEQGYILADNGRIGGGGSSGTDASLFRIRFQAVGPGASDIFFGTVQLRNSANEPIAFQLEQGLVSAVSPLPDASYTRMYNPPAGDAALAPMGATGVFARVDAAGSGPRAKLTAARYDGLPPGGDAAPFIDPDDEIRTPAVADRYWELTSSLGAPSRMTLAFSLAGAAAPEGPSGYRLAVRPGGSGPDDPWHVLPRADVLLDARTERLYVTERAAVVGSLQFALVFEATVATEAEATPGVLTLEAVYPNPFRDRLTLRYRLGEQALVRLLVHDLLGREVAVLVREPRSAGWHEVVWRAEGLTAGVYVLRLEAAGAVVARRVTRLR